MSGRDDLDLYGRGAAPERAPAARGFARVVGVVTGAVISLYGMALFVLRCFDTCPTDPSLDKAVQLVAGTVVTFGLVVVIASVSIGTRLAARGAALVCALGAAIATAGVATLALVPSIDDPGGHGGTPVAGATALLVGGAVAVTAAIARRRAGRRAD